jgi:hypothetical protein
MAEKGLSRTANHALKLVTLRAGRTRPRGGLARAICRCAPQARPLLCKGSIPEWMTDSGSAILG